MVKLLALTLVIFKVLCPPLCAQAPKVTVTNDTSTELYLLILNLQKQSGGILENTRYAAQAELVQNLINKTKSKQQFQLVKTAGFNLNQVTREITCQVVGSNKDQSKGLLPTYKVTAPQINSAMDHLISLENELLADVQDADLGPVLSESLSKSNQSISAAVSHIAWQSIADNIKKLVNIQVNQVTIKPVNIDIDCIFSGAINSNGGSNSVLLFPESLLSSGTAQGMVRGYPDAVLVTAQANAVLMDAFDALQDRLNRHFSWLRFVDENSRVLPVNSWDSAVRTSISGILACAILKDIDPWISETLQARLEAEFPWCYFLNRVRQSALPSKSATEFVKAMLDELDKLQPVVKGGIPVDLGLDEVGLTDVGLPVGKVIPNKAAARVGMKSGDLVTAIGGVQINGSESYLKAWAKWEKAVDGDIVLFSVKRGKTPMQFKILKDTIGGEFSHFKRKP